MMKFICLKYRDRQQWKAFSDQSRLSYRQESQVYDEKLRVSGHLIASESMDCIGEGVGLSSFQGQLVVAGEGSHHENEQLEGLMFLEARDLNHAIVLIADHPGIKAGWFKIHPADDREGIL